MRKLFCISFRKNFCVASLFGLISPFLAQPTNVVAQQKPTPLPPVQSAPGSEMVPGKTVDPASLPQSRIFPEQEQDVPLGSEIDESAMMELKLRVQRGTVPVPEGTQQDLSPAAPLPVEGAGQPTAPGTPSASAATLVSSFNTFPYTTWKPPDPTIAAGPSELVVAVNSSLRIYDKAGTGLLQTHLLTWFATVLPSDTRGIRVFDPWLLYDSFNGRFVFVAIALAETGPNAGLSRFLISTSKTNSALQGWCSWSLNGRLNGSTDSGYWADYPKTGVSSNAIIVSANMFNFATLPQFQYAKVRFLAKSVFYNASCPAPTWWDTWDYKNFDGSKAFTVLPTHSYVPSRVNYLISSRSDRGNYLSLWSSILSNPSLAPIVAGKATLTVPAFITPPLAEQPGTTTRIDTGGVRLRNAVYRSTGLWTAHATGCRWGGDTENRSCIRWYQINPFLGSLMQTGTYGSPGVYYYYPAISPDASQNAVIVFNRSSSAEYASSYFTSRSNADLLGSLPGNSVRLRAGQGCYIKLDARKRNRWGDYNGISFDPSTNRTWIMSEHAVGTSTNCTETSPNVWGTAVGQISQQ